MGVFLYLAIALIGLAYLWVKKRYNYWTDRGFLSADASFPFGMLKGVGSTITQAERTEEIYSKFKGKAQAVGMFFFLNPVILPVDIELIKNILIRDFSSFHDRGFFYNKKDQPVSANLLTLEGQEWRDRRVKLSPIFTSGKMKMMFDIVDGIGEKLVKIIGENLKEKDFMDMRNLSAKYTGDVIGNAAFGLECNCLEDPNSEFMKNARGIFDVPAIEILKFFFTAAYPELSRKLKLGTFPDKHCKFFENAFMQTLSHREKSNVKRNDFIALLLSLKDSFTMQELAAESFLVYVGGFESSSTLMTFTMYELALNPDIQDRLRAEITKNLEENDGKLTYDMLFSMKYLDMVINESLRKYPPIPNQSRVCTKEYKIPGTELVIPKGTTIDIATFSIHRDPEYYPDPEKFDPERFTPEETKARNPLTFQPFGEGPRNCIGMRFALMQSKLAIVKVLTNFELSKTEKTPMPLKLVPNAPFLAPVGDMNLKLTRIQ